VIGLINVRAVGQAWLANRDDGIAAIATFVATLALAPNIQSGMVTGITVSLALLLYRLMRPRISLLCVDKNGNLHATNDPTLALTRPEVGAIRFDGALRFVNVSYFEDALLRLERTSPKLKYILIQCHGINALDASGVAALVELVKRFRANGIVLVFSAIKRQVRDVMDRTGLSAVIGQENIFNNDEQALAMLNPEPATA